METEKIFDELEELDARAAKLEEESEYEKYDQTAKLAGIREEAKRLRREFAEIREQAKQLDEDRDARVIH